MESLTPGRTHGERFIERLPAHPDLRDKDVGVVIAEIFISARGRELQRANARQRIGFTDDGHGIFGVKRVGLSSGTVVKPLTPPTNRLRFQVIRDLFECFAAKLSAERGPPLLPAI